MPRKHRGHRSATSHCQSVGQPTAENAAAGVPQREAPIDTAVQPTFALHDGLCAPPAPSIPEKSAARHVAVSPVASASSFTGNHGQDSAHAPPATEDTANFDEQQLPLPAKMAALLQPSFFVTAALVLVASTLLAALAVARLCLNADTSWLCTMASPPALTTVLGGAITMPSSAAASAQAPRVLSTVDGNSGTASDAAVDEQCGSCCSGSSSTHSTDSTTASHGDGPSTSEDTDGGDLTVAEFIARHGLSRCTAVRELGAGSSGRVELVSVLLADGATTHLAARKTTLRTSLTEDKEFECEVAGLRAGAGCPHAIKMLAHATYEGRHEILMALAEGGSLEQELESAVEARKAAGGRPRMILGEARIKEVAVALLQAAVWFHEQGLVHMDIKPQNVLLGPSDHLLLADFGCMRRHDASGHVASCAGTTLFMAPEVVAGFRGQEARRTVKLDTYSIGALLACCAARHGRTELYGYLECGRPLPNYMPAGLRQFIDLLVSPDAELRPTAAQALQHAYLAPPPPPHHQQLQPAQKPQPVPAGAEKRRRSRAAKAKNAVTAEGCVIPGW
ncbi:SPS1/STE20-related protein kinase YSK4, partial [Tetrabaena socialis]